MSRGLWGRSGWPQRGGGAEVAGESPRRKTMRCQQSSFAEVFDSGLV